MRFENWLIKSFYCMYVSAHPFIDRAHDQMKKTLGVRRLWLNACSPVPPALLAWCMQASLCAWTDPVHKTETENLFMSQIKTFSSIQRKWIKSVYRLLLHCQARNLLRAGEVRCSAIWYGTILATTFSSLEEISLGAVVTLNCPTATSAVVLQGTFAAVINMNVKRK